MKSFIKLSAVALLAVSCLSYTGCSEAMDKAKEAGGGMVDAAKEAGGEMKDKVMGAGSDAKEAAAGAGSDMKEAATEAVEE